MCQKNVKHRIKGIPDSFGLLTLSPSYRRNPLVHYAGDPFSKELSALEVIFVNFWNWKILLEDDFVAGMYDYGGRITF